MRRPSPAVSILALLLLLNGVALAALLALGATTRQTALHDARVLVLGRQQADSWRVMGMAIDYLRTAHEENVYDGLLFGQGIKFQYPLSSLLFVRNLSMSTLAHLSQLSILVTAVAVWRILRLAMARAGLAVRDDLWLAVGVFGVTAMFHPVMTAFTLGQIQAWINAAFACALLAWMAGRDRTAGVLVGLMLLIKPTFAPLLLWGLIRRRHAFWMTAAAVAVAGTAVGAFAFGVDDTLAYLKALNYIGARGEAFHPNQSWNGLLQRLFENGDNMQFDRAGFPPPHVGVSLGTLVALVALMALALWKPLRAGAGGTVVDLSIMAVTLTMTSPVAWDHHYGVLLPILAAIAPAMLVARVCGRFTLPLLLGCALVAAQPLLFLRWFAPSPWNLAQSHLLAAACVILWCCYKSLPAFSGVERPASSVQP